MDGPRPANVIALILLVLFLAVVGAAAVVRARLAGHHADAEEERRPRSIGAEGDRTRPDWFRNMDRDSDGMLSRQEFVGTDEQFGKIDADRDGFISPAEARAADEWFRAEVPR